MGFSVLWGALLGVALSRDDHDLAIYSAVGMALTVVLTVVLYRQQSELRALAETDSLTGLTNHRGFQQALRSELRRAGARRSSCSLRREPPLLDRDSLL